MKEAAIFQLALFAAEQLLKLAPQLFLAFQSIVSRQTVTVEELQAKRAAIAAQKFEDLVPNSELPVEPDVPQAPVS